MFYFIAGIPRFPNIVRSSYDYDTSIVRHRMTPVQHHTMSCQHLRLCPTNKLPWLREGIRQGPTQATYCQIRICWYQWESTRVDWEFLKGSTSESQNSRQWIFVAPSIQWRTAGLSYWSCSLHSVHKRINDIVRNLESGISLFADDAKVYRRIATTEDVETLQRDMDRLSEWSRKWLLSFNVEKCKTMHIGHRKPRNDYQLQGITLEKSDLEKDLVVFVSSDLKPSAHVAKIAAKANARVGLIKRTFTSLYTTLVRPILDYGVQCWSPYLVKDINKLEQVQQRATLLARVLNTAMRKDVSYWVCWHYRPEGKGETWLRSTGCWQGWRECITLKFFR